MPLPDDFVEVYSTAALLERRAQLAIGFPGVISSTFDADSLKAIAKAIRIAADEAVWQAELADAHQARAARMAESVAGAFKTVELLETSSLSAILLFAVGLRYPRFAKWLTRVVMQGAV